MSRRILTATLLVAALTTLLLGIPLGILGARVERQAVLSRLSHSARAVAAVVTDRLDHQLPLDPERLVGLLPAGTSAQIALTGSVPIQLGAPLAAPVVTEGSAIGGVIDPDGGQLGEVVVSAPQAQVTGPVVRAWLVIIALAAIALAAAAWLGHALARRLSAPLEALSRQAARLGEGDVRPADARYAIAEVERVAAALSESGSRLVESLRRERRFATDVSHELRSPLAALSLRLEEIEALVPPGSPAADEATAALSQLDRLQAVVADLLDRSRAPAAASQSSVDVGALLAHLVEEYRPLAARARRRIELELHPGQPASAVVVRTRQTSLSVAVSALLDNALRHGAGTVTCSLTSTGGQAVVQVRDEGPGVPVERQAEIFTRSMSGAGSTGLGLALARALVESVGGRLELTTAGPPTFTIFLPALSAAPITPVAPAR